jgi:CO/xanthine dehydrogenase Mo-binding subunit
VIAVGQNVRRKEAPNKVTGRAKYNADIINPGELVAVVLKSSHAHARIRSIDTEEAGNSSGVVAVLTAKDTNGLLCGEVLADRPPLAAGKVRYWGEPVALVVALTEAEALRALSKIRVEYDPLPVVNTPREAIAAGAPLVHEHLASYQVSQKPVAPKPGTNIADHAKIRKGDMAKGWAQSDVVVEARFSLPQVDHAAMETRSAKVEILHDGRVIVHSTTQSPFEIQKLLSSYFKIDPGQVIVNAPLLGGAFGGKAAVQLEVLAYLASRAARGRLVRIVNSREDDMASSPVGMGLQATIKLGASRDGRLQAAELTYLIDTGAYTDSSPRVARAIAAQSTGPYAVDNVQCDVYAVYTNHTYTTAFRGFGHLSLTFGIERAMDKLAHELQMDPLQLRLKNALAPGDTTPTQVMLSRSNLGDLAACIEKIREMTGWDEGQVVQAGPHTVRAKGLACFWKTSSSPPNAVSGVVITMNADGSLNLSTGTVEVGAGTKTTAAQILAEVMQMDVSQIHVHTHINTKVDPEHWKTVASLSTFMVGRAVLAAADDVIRQLKEVASQVLRCSPDDLAVGGRKVYLTDDPTQYMAFKDIAHGYMYNQSQDGIGAQIIGRGSYIIRHISVLDEETGAGRPGRAWTVGAQAVEIEVDTREWTYRLLSASTVMDAGRVINPKAARGVVMGGMCQGLGYGTREGLLHTRDGVLLNDQLRTYKVMRPGEQPLQYRVEFVETPQLDAPYGARPIGEHGILAMPAAVANALSRAAGVDFDEVPVTPEQIWRKRMEAGLL